MNKNIIIKYTILSGNLDGEWKNENEAAECFADFLETRLYEKAYEIFDKDDDVFVEVFVQRNCSGYTRELSVLVFDDEEITPSDTAQIELQQTLRDAWNDWIESAEAKELFTD